MSQETEERAARSIRIDVGMLGEMDSIARWSGVSSADLHRLAVRRFIESVRQAGCVELPSAPFELSKEGARP